MISFILKNDKGEINRAEIPIKDLFDKYPQFEGFILEDIQFDKEFSGAVENNQPLKNNKTNINSNNKVSQNKSISLNSSYKSLYILSKLLMDFAEKENKIGANYLDSFEKTQNRLFACNLASKMLSNSSKFKLNFKTFFDKYINRIYEFYDITHVDLDWDVCREFGEPILILIVSFCLNEILSEILKHASPQVIETIRINICSLDNYINLVIWTDLIFFNDYEVNEEYIILNKILKDFGVNDHLIEVNDEGTLFDIKFNKSLSLIR